MKILYATSEARPFAASGGLADVAGSLPQAIRARMVGCRVVMPLYESVPATLRENMTFLTSFTVPVAWRRQYCGVFEARIGGVIYYLLDNQYYFKRVGLYGHYDDAERFAFFSRAVLELISHIDYRPDVLHANDWQTALVPVYYRMYYQDRPDYAEMKTMYTVHNIQYQGKYGLEILEDVFGIGQDHRGLVELDGCINLAKGAVECADSITTVSPTYAQELTDPWFAHGLDGMFRAREYKLTGILNGIDTTDYNPETDPELVQCYSAEVPAGKAACKTVLQKECGLPQREDVPLIAMVTRLVSHKGLDLVRHMLDGFLRDNDVQMVVLGSGEWVYEQFFRDMQLRHKDKLCFYEGFFSDVARHVYGGADIFLMPSKSEPCGLSQMIACRYGALPVVRATGGLKDSIIDCGEEDGFGFTFQTYNSDDMTTALYRALGAYSNKGDFSILQQRAMEKDFSWSRSAGDYVRLYKQVISG